ADRKRRVPDAISAIVKEDFRLKNWFPHGLKGVVDYSRGESPLKNATFKELIEIGGKAPAKDGAWIGPWLPDDVAFGQGPVHAGDIILGTSANKPIARVAEIGAAELDRALDGMRLAANTQNESGSLGGAMRSGRTLRTPEFTLEFGNAYALVKG